MTYSEIPMWQHTKVLLLFLLLLLSLLVRAAKFESSTIGLPYYRTSTWFTRSTRYSRFFSMYIIVHQHFHCCNQYRVTTTTYTACSSPTPSHFPFRLSCSGRRRCKGRRFRRRRTLVALLKASELRAEGAPPAASLFLSGEVWSESRPQNIDWELKQRQPKPSQHM